MYGNPDGSCAVSFDIALPSWIVEKKNSIWVLGLYALLFMVALPLSVGTWWHCSIHYSGDQVLLDTTQNQMSFKRVFMIFEASAEFHRRNKPKEGKMPTGNMEASQLMKRLPQLNEKNKEKPMYFIDSIKPRSLLHAHLPRLDLSKNILEEDRIAVVS